MLSGFTAMGVNAAAWTIPAFVATTADPLHNHTRVDPRGTSSGSCAPPHDCMEVYGTNQSIRCTPADVTPSPGSVLISTDHLTALEGFGCKPDGASGFSCVGSAVNVDLTGNVWDAAGIWSGDSHPARHGGNGSMELWHDGTRPHHINDPGNGCAPMEQALDEGRPTHFLSKTDDDALVELGPGSPPGEIRAQVDVFVRNTTAPWGTSPSHGLQSHSDAA